MEETKQIVKVQYYSDDERLSDRAYTYYSEAPLAVGDIVTVPVRDTSSDVLALIVMPASVLKGDTQNERWTNTKGKRFAGALATITRTMMMSATATIAPIGGLFKCSAMIVPRSTEPIVRNSLARVVAAKERC